MPKKQHHHNKVWYKKFEDIVNFQHAHGGRTDMKRRENKQLSYWVKITKFTASSCRMSIHRRPQSASKTLKTLDLSGRLKRRVQVKVPSARKKIPDDSKKGICACLSCTIVSEAIPIILMSWIPDFSSVEFTMERQNNWEWRLFFVPGTYIC